jgi:cell division protein FtsW
VARLRGDAVQPSAAMPATTNPLPPMAPSTKASEAARGTSRLRQRVEPSLGRTA